MSEEIVLGESTSIGFRDGKLVLIGETEGSVILRYADPITPESETALRNLLMTREADRRFLNLTL